MLPFDLPKKSKSLKILDLNLCLKMSLTLKKKETISLCIFHMLILSSWAGMQLLSTVEDLSLIFEWAEKIQMSLHQSQETVLSLEILLMTNLITQDFQKEKL